jgi:hypothetical protein
MARPEAFLDLVGAFQRALTVHVAHADCDVYVTPPTEYVPAPHGFAVSDAVPAGQK